MNGRGRGCCLRPAHHQRSAMPVGVVYQPGVNRRCGPACGPRQSGWNPRHGPKCGPQQVGLSCRLTRRARLNRGPCPIIKRHRLARLKRFSGEPRPRIKRNRPARPKRFSGRPRLLIKRHRPATRTRRVKGLSGDPRQRFICMVQIPFPPHRGGKDTLPKWLRRDYPSPGQRVSVPMSRRFSASSANSNSGQGSSVRLKLERKYLPFHSFSNPPPE